MRLAAFALVMSLTCCSAAPPPSAAPSGSAPPALAEATAPARTPFPCSAKPNAIGRLHELALNEVSGIVESSSQPGVFFVHNDSGDSPRFFAIDLEGRVLAQLVLSTVPMLIDAEDIAAGPGPDGKRYLYLGDTGNNFASMGMGIPRRKAVIYRILEPTVPAGSRSLTMPLDRVTPLVFTFPEGARDIEAFIVDPRSGDLLLIGKQPDGHSQLLGATAAELAAGGGELHLLGHLTFGTGALPGSPMPTSASISADGSRILVRTYTSVFAFERGPAESVAAALARPPRVLTAPTEQQGEAISFADQGRAFVTISEGVRPQIFCGSW